MKTINISLPVYDNIAKQCYERVRASKLDKLVPVKCPRYRLPSMLWNVEADDPGEIVDIELLSKTYSGTDLGVAPANGYPGQPETYSTFTVVGNAITSAIQVNVVTSLGVIMALLSGKSRMPVSLEFTLTLGGGELPYFYLFNGSGAQLDMAQAVEGANQIIFDPQTDYTGARIMILNSNLTNWSCTAIIIKQGNIKNYFNTTASYIQGGGGAGWNDAGTYDTFTVVDSAITRALKTTAPGEDYCYNVAAVGSVPTTLAVGDVIRVVADLTLAGGTAPKMCLRNTGTAATISNIVTMVDGVNYIYLVSTAALASGWAITLYNSDTETCDWSCTFTGGAKTVIPRLYTEVTDEYFQYKGETLGTLIPDGIYYLKFTTENYYVFYSDWFEATCIYPNIITAWANQTYETFTTNGTAITSAIETGVAGEANSSDMSMIAGEKIHMYFFLTSTSGALPRFTLYSGGVPVAVASAGAVIGLNEIELESEITSDAIYIIPYNTAAANWSTTEILVTREYSAKYLRFNFSNTCDLGDILYADGLTQSIWIESEPLEMTYPLDEEGAKDGNGRFIRSFGRQTKKYSVRTKEMPAFMVETFYRMMLHDTVEMIDLVGDENTVYNLEVEHEWIGDDKYYAQVSLTFDLGEVFVIGGCCNNIT